MKAIICKVYGSAKEALELQEVTKPQVKDDEILIKIYATSVHRGDTRIRSLEVPGPSINKLLARFALGFTKPRNAILGMELAGVVESIGKDVTKYKVGDKVFASTAWEKLGAYAEYKCMPERAAVALKPSNLTFEEAAVIPSGGVTAMWVMDKANIKANQKVLVYGASGSIGTFITQLSKLNEADVTCVCSGENVELVKSLGASNVIDYTKTDIVEVEDRYDVIIDCVGYLAKSRAKNLLAINGTYLEIHSASNGLKKDQALVYLQKLSKLYELGKLKSVIDRTYSLSQIIEAHNYVDNGHKKGNVAILIAE